MHIKYLRFIICLFLILLSTAQGYSQEVITECLGIELPNYRWYSLLPSDPVEMMMVSNDWKPPAEGKSIRINDTLSVCWEKIKADSSGWFSGDVFNTGYAYVQVNSDKNKVMLLEAMGNFKVYVNGEPRIGNQYQYKDEYEFWEPRFDFCLLPIKLKKGRNDLLFQCMRGMLKVKLHRPETIILFNNKDITLPDLLIGEATDTWGAIVVINATDKPLRHALISSPHPLIKLSPVPIIQPMSVRKVGFRLQGPAPAEKGPVNIPLILSSGDQVLSNTTIQFRVLSPLEIRKCTFISQIDGSVQYYALNPAQKNPDQPKALVLTVHGAAVEAFNQANSYYPKSWAHIVAPTNRRPYGYNWEDWGRLDALEVLRLVKQKLNIDSTRVYLTGHSMGGHGTWHLGALYPDQFAAIGPSAGWISFWSYRVREQKKNLSPAEQLWMRPTSPSNTIALSPNYRQMGLYIIHGALDDNVPVEQSQLMVAELEKFHHDFVYHQQDSVGHWWDLRAEPGADCVDWPPLFDFFARHRIPDLQQIRTIDFITPSPGISSKDHWLSIAAQQRQYEFSKVRIQFDPGMKRFHGTTVNVLHMGLDLELLSPGDIFIIQLDNQAIENLNRNDYQSQIWLENFHGRWTVVAPWSMQEKGPHRYGTLKDGFNNNMLFVYGTQGNREENVWAFNKARFDAETFWYQGNGSVDIIADAEFNPGADPDRSVILYGNADTNAAWKYLLTDSPVQVSRNRIGFGKDILKGSDLACLFIRPRKGSMLASICVIAGSGIKGMRLTVNRPYLYPGFGFPDIMIFDSTLLKGDSTGMKLAGFFGIDWSVENGEFVINN